MSSSKRGSFRFTAELNNEPLHYFSDGVLIHITGLRVTLKSTCQMGVGGSGLSVYGDGLF